MELFIIKRWDIDHPKNEITNRLEYFDYEITFNYSSNQTTTFTVAYIHTVRRDIFQGDILYAPDFKFAGIVKSYDPSTGKIVVGDALNIYQYPQALPNMVTFNDPAGTLINQLNSVATNQYPEMKTEMFSWVMATDTPPSKTTINYGNGQKGMNIVEFWEFASKIMSHSRGTDQTKGLRIYVDNVTTMNDNGVRIVMKLANTKTTKSEFAYHMKDPNANRFIENLEVNDKVLTKNSVIIYDENGNKLSQWYLHMDTGKVDKVKPNPDQYPIYIDGYILDTSQQDHPSELEAAVGQLPINQSDSFTFEVPMTQGYITYEDVMVNTLISMALVDGKKTTRVLRGSVTTLKVTQEKMSVSVGMEKPRLTLQA